MRDDIANGTMICYIIVLTSVSSRSFSIHFTRFFSESIFSATFVLFCEYITSNEVEVREKENHIQLLYAACCFCFCSFFVSFCFIESLSGIERACNDGLRFK